MEWIFLVFALEGGYIPFLTHFHDGDTQYFHNNIGYTRFEADVYITKYFYIGGSAESLFIPEEINSYYCFNAEYTFSAGIEYEMFTIGFEHTCAHPVNPYDNKHSEQIGFDMAQERLFIRISNEKELSR